MVLELTLTRDAQEAIEAWTREQGVSVEQYVSALVDREGTRLWHVLRCRVRPKDKKPIGRPPLTMRAREVRELGDTLRTIMFKRRGLNKPSLEWEEKIEQAIAGEDLEALQAMFDSQPWAKKWPEPVTEEA